MAKSSVAARSHDFWNRPLIAGLRSFLARLPLPAWLALAFFSVTIVAYYYTSPRSTSADNFVYLAHSFVHGRLDIPYDLYLPFEWAIKDGKYYIIPPPMPAIIILPGVLLYGLALNQALASIVVGAINASVVCSVIRGLREKLTAQLWLSALFVFGTIYWYAAANGGVWFFSHTVATIFLFLAIYATLSKKNPFLAGIFLGAAYMSRYPTILSLPFFVIMFSEQWLPESKRRLSMLRRFDLRPLLRLGLGLGALMLVNFTYNYLRFDTPLDASYHYRDPVILAEHWWAQGEFNISHMPLHFPVIFKALPAFQAEAPFILAPSIAGMAIWATTPAFIYALFTDLKSRPMVVFALILFLFPITLFLLSARGMPLEDRLNLRYGLDYYPFAILVVMATAAAIQRRNKFVLACWAAIIPMALTIFTYAVTGWAQFGYRYALDFYPFLFLLTVQGMGAELRWHHKSLIALSVAINLWAVLAIYNFQPHGFLGLTWTTS